MTWGRLAVAASLLAACGDNVEAPPGPCWPLDASPGGSVEIGTGDVAFQPMPDMLPIIANGTQSDPFLQVYGRIEGIPPGNPADFLDPSNPKTKITAVIADLGLTLGVPCPASIGFVPASVPGAFDMLHSLRIGLGTTPIAQIAGHRARITIEVVGSNGLYAQDAKDVVITMPITSGVDAGVDGDAAVDAGP